MWVAMWWLAGVVLFVCLERERRRIADRCKEWGDLNDRIRDDLERQVAKRGELQDELNKRDAQIESLETTVKELQVQVGKRDKDVSDVMANLSKRDAELKNLRDAATRREAVIEGLRRELTDARQNINGAQSRSDFFQKQLEATRISSESEKVDTARLRERLAGAERQLGIQRMSAKSLVEVKTNLEKQLSAAKALLAGVKIGVGELLIVQPDGDCTDADVNALRREMGPIDGKVVVVRHVNAWRAVPIPRDIATKVEEPQGD